MKIFLFSFRRWRELFFIFILRPYIYISGNHWKEKKSSSHCVQCMFFQLFPNYKETIIYLYVCITFYYYSNNNLSYWYPIIMYCLCNSSEEMFVSEIQKIERIDKCNYIYVISLSTLDVWVALLSEKWLEKNKKPKKPKKEPKKREN